MEFASREAVQEYAQTTGRQYVQVTLDHAGNGELGSLIIELYTDQCPKTCENFINGVKGKFSGGFKYQGSPIHRIVKHAYIQGGDVVDGTGKGNPGWSIPDESFALKHDDVGWVGMANMGQPHTAATQFYITLQPLTWLDGKRVVFGKVVDAAGLELLRQVEGLPTNNERPLPEVTVSKIELIA
uniref:Peptidyl-prolyl cis-trans isomerase n=1 Tax=Chlamydomonas leiostraca TaxID=1034604 RepID=A0A7S0WF71_9CHLO